MNKDKRNSQNNCGFLFYITKIERMFRMPLSHLDQITLLKDILNNHQVDCCGSVSECEQLERLVKSLLVDPNIDASVKPVLQEVYNYSQHGQYTQHLNSHIEANQDNLSQWVDQININF